MSGMASFLAGFGGGYLKADRQKTLDERQAKLDAQNEQIFNWKKDEVDRENNLRISMQDAFAPRTAEQGTVTEANMGEGAPMQRMFTKDPGQAAALKETMDAEAELRGMGPSTQQQGHAITGAMAKGHEIKAGQAPAFQQMSDMNSEEAQNKRAIQVMRQHGKPLEALQMNNAVMDSKIKKLGLSREEAKFADDEFNRKLTKDLDAHPDWTVGAAQILTDTKVGGLNGLTVSARPSKDGKTVEFIGVGQDGTEKVLKSFKNGPEGKAEFLQTAGRTSFENKVNFVVEKAKSDKEQSNKDREFALKEEELKAKIPLYNAQATAYRGLATQRQTAAANGSTPAVGLKERREILSDFSELLPKPDNPETFQSNAKFLQQADAIFSDNAQFGTVLTAPQVMAATQLAADPKNIKLVQGQQSGKTYQTVAVSGRRVIVGMATQKQSDQSPPQTVQTTQAAKPPASPAPAPRPAYVPPADSPAGKAASNRAALEAQSMQKMQATTNAALAAIQSGDPMAADAVRGMPGFMSLPREQKAQLQKIIFGR